MSNINCILIDDDKQSLMLLEKCVRKSEGFNLIGVYTDAGKGYDHIMNPTEIVHLVFLDIDIHGVNSIDDIGKRIPKSTKIIYVTGHPEFALRSFETQVIDFIVKPVFWDRFKEAADKARDTFAYLLADKVLYIVTGGKQMGIAYHELLYVESKNKMLHYNTVKGSFPVYSTLKKAEEELKNKFFYRVHYGFLINYYEILSFTTEKVTLTNGKEIPITVNVQVIKSLIEKSKTIPQYK